MKIRTFIHSLWQDKGMAKCDAWCVHTSEDVEAEEQINRSCTNENWFLSKSELEQRWKIERIVINGRRKTNDGNEKQSYLMIKAGERKNKENYERNWQYVPICYNIQLRIGIETISGLFLLSLNHWQSGKIYSSNKYELEQWNRGLSTIFDSLSENSNNIHLQLMLQ